MLGLCLWLSIVFVHCSIKVVSIVDWILLAEERDRQEIMRKKLSSDCNLWLDMLNGPHVRINIVTLNMD